MTFAEGTEAGWHVLIGENGSGKSTIVRATALGLLDYADISAAGQVWDDWLNTRIGTDKIGSINLGISFKEFGTGYALNRILFDRQYYGEKIRADLLEIIFRGRPSCTRQAYATTTVNTSNSPGVCYPSPTPTPSPPAKEAWLSVACGPFRRFTGGSPEKDRLYLSNPKLGAHLSVFGEDIALSEALAYLQDLYVKQLDKKPDGKTFRAMVYQILSQYSIYRYDPQPVDLPGCRKRVYLAAGGSWYRWTIGWSDRNRPWPAYLR